MFRQRLGGFRQSLSDWGYVQADFQRLGKCLGRVLPASFYRPGVCLGRLLPARGMFRQTSTGQAYVQAHSYRLGIREGGSQGRDDGQKGRAAEKMGRGEGGSEDGRKDGQKGRGRGRRAEKTGRREGGRDDGQKRWAEGKGAGMMGRRIRGKVGRVVTQYRQTVLDQQLSPINKERYHSHYQA